MTDPAERGVPTEPKEQGALTVDDPIEIAEEAIANTHDLDVRDVHYAKAVIAAIEAAGFRIVSGETTTAMDTAVADYFSGSLSDWRQCWRDLIAAAPLHGKG